MKTTRWLFALGGAALLNLGCPTPGDEGDEKPALLALTADEAALTATNNIESHLVAIADTLKMMKDSELLRGVFGGGSSSPDCPPDAPDCAPGSPGGNDWELGDEADDATDWLRDHVFAAANVESTTATSVTFRLKAEQMCEEREDSTGAIARDPDCVKVFTEIPFVFVATTRTANDLDLEFKVGATRPADLQIHDELLSVSPNLGEIRKAATLVAGVLGEDLDGFPAIFEGQARIVVSRDATSIYSATVSVLSAIHVSDHPATHKEHYDVVLAPATDALRVTLSGPNKNVFAEANFNALDVIAALDLFAGKSSTEECTPATDPNAPPECTTTPAPEPLTGLIAAHVAGASAKVNFSVTNDVVTVENIGLGNETSTVKFNGTQILALDLNKDSGRRVAVTVARDDATKKTTVSVSPSFAARLVHDLNPVKPQVDDVPAWALSGFAEVKFDGQTPKFEVTDGSGGEMPPCEPGTECGEPTPRVEAKFQVVSGKVTLAANGITPIVIDAPSCVVEHVAPEGTELAHPFMSVESGACE